MWLLWSLYFIKLWFLNQVYRVYMFFTTSFSVFLDLSNSSHFMRAIPRSSQLNKTINNSCLSNLDSRRKGLQTNFCLLGRSKPALILQTVYTTSIHSIWGILWDIQLQCKLSKPLAFCELLFTCSFTSSPFMFCILLTICLCSWSVKSIFSCTRQNPCINVYSIVGSTPRERVFNPRGLTTVIHDCTCS